ncbi:DUF7700 domain-containing protein [Rhodococcus sp. BE178]|uniref:DUF7700 domain-containing protein n=1 Tax=Rhodococcus sp. BE178 TaxID=2817737 RepID=UPI003D250339
MNPSGIEAYRLGRSFDVMPIPMDPEHCVYVPAGPLTFVVESRRLTDEPSTRTRAIGAVPDATYDSGGACVHVLDTVDRLERLRFDCFDNEPHYHYIHQSEQVNVVVRFDQFAEGDPREWTLERLRSRLPHMLEPLGSVRLADEVRAADLGSAIDEVARLLDIAG